MYGVIETHISIYPLNTKINYCLRTKNIYIEKHMSKNIILKNWNTKKQLISKKENRKHFKERDVYFMSVGENIGFEQNGKGKDFLRPVLIYKKFSKEVFLGIPLTTNSKENKFYAPFKIKDKRLFDDKRIKYFYGRTGVKSFNDIKEKLIKLLQ